MKTTKRLVALLLTLVMILSCAPISIFAEETATAAPLPIADTYVSAMYPDTAFGTGYELRINGGKNENVVLITYEASVLGGKDTLDLSIPVSNDAYVNVEIFLVDGYEVDEEALTYEVYSDEVALTESLGEYVIKGGDNAITLSGFSGKVNSSKFTLVIKSTDEKVHLYHQDFEGFTTSSTKPASGSGGRYSAGQVSGTDYYVGYHTDAFRTAGIGTGVGSHEYAVDAADANNMVLRYSKTSGTSMGAHRTYFFNLLSDTAITKDSDGKIYTDGNVEITNNKYRFSAKVKGDEGLPVQAIVAPTHGTGGNSGDYKTGKNLTVSSDNWTTVSVDYEINAAHVEALVSGKGYTDPVFGLGFRTPTLLFAYYIDDLHVIQLTSDDKEMEAVMPSREMADFKEEIEIDVDCKTTLYDTYVSAAYPDAVFGDKDELRLNGGKNENIMFATYSSKLIEDDGTVVLTIPALNDAYVNAELFLIDGYCVNEKKLNYNNMPKLDGSDIELADKTTTSAVSLGKYVIKGGENSIVLDAEKIGNVERECFTIAIKATDDEKDVYVFDFIPELELDLSSPAVNKSSIFGTHVVSYEGEDEEIHAYTHNSDGKIAFLGNFTDLQIRNDDAYGELYYFSVINMGAYGVYNALSDEAIIKDANGDVWTRGVKITGKTYRFSAIVRSNSGTKYYAVGAGPAVADGQYKGYDEENGIPDPLNNFYVKSDFIGTDIRNWVRPTVDYTVNPNHIADDTYGNYVTYPAFIIRGASRTDGKVAATGQVADLHTVELTADGKEREVVLNSIEGSETDTLKIEISDAKYAIINDVADANAINVFEFKAPKLGAVSNAEGKVDLVIFKKGIETPVLSADPDTGALIIGSNGQYYEFCDDKGNTLTLSATEETAVAVVYNDITGKARYFVNKDIAYISKGGELVPAVDLPIYDEAFTSSAADKMACKLFVGLYVDDSFITAEDYALAVTKINNDNAEVIAYQESTVSNGIRIIAGLDSLYYTSVGFDVEIYEGGELVKSESVSDNIVYSSILADGGIEITAKEKGYNYLATLNIVNLPEDIPENSYIKVRSFTEIAGIKHYDEVAKIEVTNDGYGFGEIPDNERYTKKQAVLLMGQSNMAGRGVIGTVEPITDSRITMLRADGWVPMEAPIHQDKSAAGVGLAESFAKAFVETFDCELGLIPCAYGGTSLSEWQKDSTVTKSDYFGGKKNYQLYANAVAMAKQAMEDGTEICAILWHQGESGSASDAQYGEKVKALLDGFIEDIGLDPEKVIVITGELGCWKGDIALNSSLHTLADTYTNYGVAESDNLPNNPNDTAHMLAACYRVFGYRYFDQFYKILTGKNYTNFVDDYTYYELKNEDDNEDDNDEVVDTTSYMANIDFNGFTAGTKYTADTTVDNVKFVAGGSSVEIIGAEGNDSEKYAAVNLASGKTSPWIDIATSYQKNEVVITEAKFTLGDGFGGEGSLIQLVGATSIPLVKIGTDGTLYNVTGSGEKGSAIVNPENQNTVKVELFERMNVKVIANFAKNTKDIYIDGVLCVSGAALTDSVATSSAFTVVSTRLLQFDGTNGTGAIYVDDFKSYKGDDPTNDSDPNINYIVNESFEGFTVGNITATVNGVKPTRVTDADLKIVGNTGNKYLSFSNATSSNSGARVDSTNTVVSAGNDIVVEAKLRIAKYGNNDFAASGDIFKLVQDSDNTIPLFWLDKTGKLLTAKGGTALATLSETSWTSIKVVCDFTNNVKEVYVNGELVEGEFALNTKSTVDHTTFVTTYMRLLDFKESSYGTVCIDNYRVYLAEQDSTDDPTDTPDTPDTPSEEPESYIVNETFSGFDNGAFTGTVNSVKVLTNQTTSVTEIVEGSGNKYLSFNSIQEKAASGDQLDHMASASEKGKDVTVEIKVKLAQYNGNAYAAKSDFLKMIDRTSGSAVTICLLNISADGKLHNTSYENGSSQPTVATDSIATLSETEWTTVKVVCHFSTNTKDIYINNVLVVEGAPMFKSLEASSAYTPQQMRLLQLTKATSYGTICLDDYKFYN